MKFKKSFFIVLINLIFIISLIPYSKASNNIQVEYYNNSNITLPEIFSDAAILLDIDSNKVLYEKNSKSLAYPASTTKLLTAILVAENCSDLNQLVNVSYYAVNSVPYSYSTANLVPGEQLTINDLLHALLIPSANDAAYALAEYVANSGNNYALDDDQATKLLFESSIASFSNMMNEKAKEIGCENTHFVNPNGIQDEQHISTAYDLMLIGRYAYSIPTVTDICKTVQGYLPNTNMYQGELRTFHTTNHLLQNESTNYYEYANGLKTGYTDLAQSCIIASANKGSRSLIVVLLHSNKTDDENQTREMDCKRLFEYGFNTFTNSILINKNTTVTELTVLNGTKESNKLNVLCDTELKTLILSNESIDVTPEIKMNKTLAPIAQNEIIGTITYNINGESFSGNLVAEHNVYPINYGYYILLSISIFFVLSIIVSLIYIKFKKKK